MFYPSLCPAFFALPFVSIRRAMARDTAGYACEMTFDFLPKTTCVASGPEIEICIEACLKIYASSLEPSRISGTRHAHKSYQG